MEDLLSTDTIAAISSAPGEGAIAVVRLSGPQALSIANQLLDFDVTALAHRSAKVGWLREKAGEVLDQAVCLVFHGPHSFTGEDVVEFQVHGGYVMPRRVLEALIAAGARPARPGEFSMRAVVHGKIDLAQAEAIQSMIGARNELAAKAARQSLTGDFSRFLRDLQTKLFDCAGILEAWVDFPEEDLEFASFEEVAAYLEQTTGQLRQLLQTYQKGQRVVEGVRICLVGIPNAGKSSLLNRLVGADRAIVTDIPGTTRDLLESDWKVGGVHVKLMDTAGIRDTEETIEAEGIRRSRQAIEDADIVLLILDSSRPDHAEQLQLIHQVPSEKTLAVLNKRDLRTTEALERIVDSLSIGQVSVSAKTADGFEKLIQQLEKMVWSGSPPVVDELILTQQRHAQAIEKAIVAFEAVIRGLRSGVSAEYVALEMRSGLEALVSITGGQVTESVLSAIFSRFCLGK
jgi:tRNA modification GTPase